MELMLVVYGVSVLCSLPNLLGMLLLGLALTSIVVWLRWCLLEYPKVEVEAALVTAKKYTFWKSAIAIGLLVTLMPSERTLQYMAGAYLIQSVYESAEAREIGAASKKAIMSQLEVWSRGNEQLLTLIEQIKPAVQEKVHDYSTTGAQQ